MVLLGKIVSKPTCREPRLFCHSKIFVYSKSAALIITSDFGFSFSFSPLPCHRFCQSDLFLSCDVRRHEQVAAAARVQRESKKTLGLSSEKNA
jgi:hypothetical protein